MKKLIIRNVFLCIFSFFFAILSCFVCVRNLSKAVKLAEITAHAEISEARKTVAVNQTDFRRKYDGMKEGFSQIQGFIDLIPRYDFSADIYDCGDEEPKIGYSSDGWSAISNAQKSQRADVTCYYDELIDNGYITVTEGRAIDTHKPYNKNGVMEIMVPQEWETKTGAGLYIALPIADENGREIVVPATVVGKFSLTLYPPLSSSGDWYFYGQKGNTPLLIPNIADEFSLEKFFGNQNSDSIELLPLFTQESEVSIDNIYSIAEGNNGVVLNGRNNSHVFALMSFAKEQTRFYDYLLTGIFASLIFAAVIVLYVVYQKKLIIEFKKHNKI